MNTEQTLPPPLPHHPAHRWAAEPFTGAVTFGSVLENLLKYPGRILHAFGSGTPGVTPVLLVCSLLCLAVFGLLLGSFSGGDQLWAAPLKVTAGTLAAMLICLPSLYIFSALGGVNARLSQIFGTLVAAMALTSVLLLGFAPVIWVFSQSSESLPFMGFLALAFWLIALVFGLRMLLAISTMHNALSLGYIKVWLAIFVVVTLQMSTALRPIIGKDKTFLPTEKRFFVEHWMEEIQKAPAKR